jgi:hypothetical protein
MVYFEVRVIRCGDIRIGLSKNNPSTVDTAVGEDAESWGH